MRCPIRDHCPNLHTKEQWWDVRTEEPGEVGERYKSERALDAPVVAHARRRVRMHERVARAECAGGDPVACRIGHRGATLRVRRAALFSLTVSPWFDGYVCTKTVQALFI